MLSLQRLESRDVPADHYFVNPDGFLYVNNPSPNLIPGWTGEEQHVVGHFDADAILDTAAVALDGGSCRLRVISGATGKSLLDVIAFDQNFRGGGNIDTVKGTLGAVGSAPDSLLLVPGAGGGPVVKQFDFDSAAGRMAETLSFFAPFPETFRGGLRLTSGDVDGDGIPEEIFLPGEGGGPQLVALDARSHEAKRSFWVGSPDDRSGDARPTPTGGIVTTRNGSAIAIQYGEVHDGVAATKLWLLATGEETTDYAPN